LTPSEINALSWGEIEYWNGWYELIQKEYGKGAKK
jgi:hypothetical protein